MKKIAQSIVLASAYALAALAHEYEEKNPDMIEVAQTDREAAANHLQSVADDGQTYDAIRRGQCDNDPLVQAFAACRIAAEKSVLNRLRNLPDDVVASAMRNLPDYEGATATIRHSRTFASALADALETKR